MGAASTLPNVPAHSDSLRCHDGLGRARSTYVRRRPEDTVLHQVVREHLETFLAEAHLRGGGEGLPRFVERELREFLGCGDLTRGFARFRCTDCQHEILVAFSPTRAGGELLQFSRCHLGIANACDHGAAPSFLFRFCSRSATATACRHFRHAK